MAQLTHSGLAMTDIGRVLGKLRALQTDLPAGERQAIESLLRAAGVVERTPLQYNPFLPGVHEDPYPHYHRLQAEHPVHWSETMQSWVVCRYADIVTALRDPRLSHRTGYRTVLANVPPAEHAGIAQVTRFLGRLLNEIDPPEHTRLRRAMMRALATAGHQLPPARLESIAHGLIDPVVARHRMDLVADLAHPLPAVVGAELLAIPAADRSHFGHDVHDIVHTFSEGFSGTAAMADGEAAVDSLISCLAHLLARRRARPGPDALSALLAVDGLTDDERVLVAANLILGLHENVTHAITLGLNTLLRQPLPAQRLLRGPDRLPTAVEEMLRHEGTAPILSRVVREDTVIGGVDLPQGAPVILLIAAANRDADRFPAPDRFIPGRSPNPHIAFGLGKRACPGATLARRIVHAAIGATLTRLPGLQLDTAAPLVWREEINIHGLSTLPVAF
ncbi:cytochrome P450 [Kitasatospora sp. NPDC087314]|uniref:cytochrome P450 n=1 Tax=Kitasatospora sp. NPDC087314 TaxID=3364068 RepID=UPI0037FBA465